MYSPEDIARGGVEALYGRRDAIRWPRGAEEARRVALDGIEALERERGVARSRLAEYRRLHDPPPFSEPLDD